MRIAGGVSLRLTQPALRSLGLTKPVLTAPLPVLHVPANEVTLLRGPAATPFTSAAAATSPAFASVAPLLDLLLRPPIRHGDVVVAAACASAAAALLLGPGPGSALCAYECADESMAASSGGRWA